MRELGTCDGVRAGGASAAVRDRHHLGVSTVPTYVSLLNWTDQGVRAYADTVGRANAATELAKKLGGALPTLLWTVGPYDLVVIAEFPDDETATAFMLATSAQGNVRTTTLRAHTAEEMAGIIGKLG